MQVAYVIFPSLYTAVASRQWLFWNVASSRKLQSCVRDRKGIQEIPSGRGSGRFAPVEKCMCPNTVLRSMDTIVGVQAQ